MAVLEYLQFFVDESRTIADYALILLSGFGAYVLYYRADTEKQIARANERVANSNIKDGVEAKFDRAIEHLKSANVGVRLRAIYSLSDIAKAHTDKAWQITYILDHFITNYPFKGLLDVKDDDDEDERNFKQRSQFYPQDRKMAIRELFGVISHALADLDSEDDDWENYIDLRHQNFRFFPLSHALIYKVDAAFSSFQNAEIHKTRFQKVYLNHTTFENSILWSCDFSQASLEHANFTGADLFGCKWKGAEISNADFRYAKNLDVRAIKKAKNWQLAKLPEHLVRSA